MLSERLDLRASRSTADNEQPRIGHCTHDFRPAGDELLVAFVARMRCLMRTVDAADDRHVFAAMRGRRRRRLVLLRSEPADLRAFETGVRRTCALACVTRIAEEQIRSTQRGEMIRAALFPNLDAVQPAS